MAKIKESLLAKGITLDEGQTKFVEELDASILEAVSNGVESLRAVVDKKMADNDTVAEELKAQVLKIASQLDAKVAGGVSAGMSAVRKSLEENKDKLTALRSGNKNVSFSMEIPMMAAATPMYRANTVTGDQHLPIPDVDMMIGRKPDPESSILTHINIAPTSKDVIAYIDAEPVEGGAAFIAEGALKPSMSFKFVTSISKVKKVAVIMKVSTEALDDLDFLESEINIKMPRELRREIQRQVIFGGSDSDVDLSGIVPFAAAYANPSMSGTVNLPSNVDAVAAAASQIFNVGYSGRVSVLMNQADIFAMRLIKDTAGNYVDHTGVLQDITIIPDATIPQGSILAGIFNFANLMVRSQGRVEVIIGAVRDSSGMVIGTDDEYNMVSLRMEARMADYIKMNERYAFVYATLAEIKADLAIS